jgi:acyl-CoA reductase-like NAD-dependent aldehyde dehydrogenase
MDQVTLKVIPAMLAGCTCVLKPSELSPLSSMLFAEFVHDSGDDNDCVQVVFVQKNIVVS